jgi:hypothetical protein
MFCQNGNDSKHSLGTLLLCPIYHITAAFLGLSVALINKRHERFEVLAAVVTKVAIFWDIKSIQEQMFRRNVSLPFSGPKISLARNKFASMWKL